LPGRERRLTDRAGLIPVASQDLDRHHTLMPQALRASTPTEVLAGLVERVTFHNEENGFCVLRVKARGQRDLITILGHAAMISAGEFVQASGTWINDRTHGVQFRAAFLKATAPTTIEGIEKYLGSGMIRGIGPIYARKLVRAFGDAVFDVIEQEPNRLREVTGAAILLRGAVYQSTRLSCERRRSVKDLRRISRESGAWRKSIWGRPRRTRRRPAP
jgi:hypothetical protein